LQQSGTGFVLALDIGATKLAAGVGTGDGEIIGQTGAPTLASDGAGSVLTRALELARRCYDEHLAAGGQLDAIGVSTMGLTFESHVKLAPNVPGWDQLRIPEAIKAAFPGLPVVIGNDVQVAAQAELTWGSLRDVEHGIYLNLGSGIAAGIVVEGKLLRGGHGAPGEVGYSLFRGRPEQRMAGDGAAPFEEWFGGSGASRRLAGSGLPESVAEVVELRDTDPAARAFVDELWDGIAVITANLCCAFDPTVVSLGGGYVRAEQGVLERLQEIVSQAVPYPPEVVRARFGADASLRGAAAAAFAAQGATA
jgi:glucokinase